MGKICDVMGSIAFGAGGTHFQFWLNYLAV